MKKILVAGALFFGMLGSVQAQTKIGYIDADELLQSMPEAAKADQELKQYQEELGSTYQDLVKELQDQDSIFVKDSAKMTASMKEIKKGELMKKLQRVQTWQQESQELYQAKAQEKIAPIRQKAMDAIKTVAKEKGYAYVLDANTLIVSPPADDILPMVQAKLGIKPKAAPAGGR